MLKSGALALLPIESSKCDFAIVGDEVYGRYYDG